MLRSSSTSHQGVADYPAAIFPAELMAAYPEAARHLVGAARGRMVQLDDVDARPLPNAPPLAGDQASPMFAMSSMYHRHCWANDFSANGKTFFRAHNHVVSRPPETNKGRQQNSSSMSSGAAGSPSAASWASTFPMSLFLEADDWLEYKKQIEREEGQKAEASEQGPET